MPSTGRGAEAETPESDREPLTSSARAGWELRTVRAARGAAKPQEEDCSRREGGRREGTRALSCRARGGVPPPSPKGWVAAAWRRAVLLGEKWVEGLQRQSVIAKA